MTSWQELNHRTEVEYAITNLKLNPRIILRMETDECINALKMINQGSSTPVAGLKLHLSSIDSLVVKRRREILIRLGSQLLFFHELSHLELTFEAGDIGSPPDLLFLDQLFSKESRLFPNLGYFSTNIVVGAASFTRVAKKLPRHLKFNFLGMVFESGADATAILRHTPLVKIDYAILRFDLIESGWQELIKEMPDLKGVSVVHFNPTRELKGYLRMKKVRHVLVTFDDPNKLLDFHLGLDLIDVSSLFIGLQGAFDDGILRYVFKRIIRTSRHLKKLYVAINTGKTENVRNLETPVWAFENHPANPPKCPTRYAFITDIVRGSNAQLFVNATVEISAMERDNDSDKSEPFLSKMCGNEVATS